MNIELGWRGVIAGFVIVMAVATLLVRGGVSDAEVAEARESAQIAADSIATLLPVLEAQQGRADAQALVVANLRDSLAAEREARAEERAVSRETITVQGRLQVELVDSAIASADSATADLIAEIQAADEAEDAAYERTIASLEDDVSDLETELAETNRALLFARDECRTCDDALTQALARGDALEIVANPPWTKKFVDGLPFSSTQGTVGFVLGLTLGFVLTR